MGPLPKEMLMFRNLMIATVLAAAVLAAGAGVVARQNLIFNGRSFAPDWGEGTTVRANDAPAVYEVRRGVGGLSIQHISPGRLDSCYGGSAPIVRVFSHALNQPSVVHQQTAATGPCLPTSARSVGAFALEYEPDTDNQRSIGASAWTNAARTRMQGVIRNESNDRTGVCGGMIVALVDRENRLLKFYTPPTGCVSGRLHGSANQRFVPWEDDIPAAIRSRIAEVRVRPVFTEGRDKASWERLTGIVVDAIGKGREVARMVGAAFGG
jgi:hypothetical protein